MLGIDLKSLTDPLYHNVIKEVLNIDLDKEKISSYQLVKCLIKNYKEVLKYDASEELRIINYYKSRIKCAIFEQLSEFEQFNFGKINTTDTSKLLYTPSNEPVCPYFLIRLSKEENEQIYGVSSLLAPEREKLSPYFSQKAAIPTQIIVDNNHDLHKFNATPKEKIDLLNMYKLIISECGVESNIDISGDYLSALSSILENQKKEKILKK